MNALQSILSSEVVTAFGWALLHSLWQGAVIALIASLIMAFQQKYNPKVRYAVFYGLLMLIPVCFAITFALVYHPMNVPLSPPQHQQFLSQSLINPGANTPEGQETGRISSWISGIAGFFEGRMHWLFLLWFGGFLAFMIRFAGSMGYIYRLRTFRLMEVSGEMQKRLKELSEQIGMRKMVRLKESALVKVPVTLGLLRPVILFPIGLLSGVPVEQIEAILLHELAHIYRRDYLLNILQSLVEMIFFYHPVTWWLSGLVRTEREHVCDDIALSIHHDRINYIKALTTMEEMNVKSSPLLATAVTGPRKRMLQRVTRLVNPEKLSKGFSESIIGFLMLVAVVITISANAIAIAGSADDLMLGDESLDGLRISVPALNNLIVKETAFIPPADPDTIITKSGSGKVIVKVVTDSTENLGDKDLNVVVLSKDGKKWDACARGGEHEKIIILKMDEEGCDSIKSVIMIKDGDSVKVYDKDLKFDWVPKEGAYHWKTLPPVPDVPECVPFIHHWESPDIGGIQKYYFSFRNDSIDTALVFAYPRGIAQDFLYDFDFDFDYDIDGDAFAQSLQENEKAMKEYEKAMQEYQFHIQGKDMERAMKEYEKAMQEYELLHKDFERQLRKNDIYVLPPVSPVPPVEWYGTPPQLNDRGTEKVIRQELREDGLVSHGKNYIIEINSKAMYINGEKQSKEVAKKYMHLVEGFEPGMLDDSGMFKIVF